MMTAKQPILGLEKITKAKLMSRPSVPNKINLFPEFARQSNKGYKANPLTN